MEAIDQDWLADCKAWLRSEEGSDWAGFRNAVLGQIGPEFLMRAFDDVNPEVLARCREVVEDRFITRGMIYYRIRIEEGLRTADYWAAPIALKDYPRQRAISEEESESWLKLLILGG